MRQKQHSVRTLVIQRIPNQENPHNPIHKRLPTRILPIEELGLETRSTRRGRRALGELAVERDERRELAALSGALQANISALSRSGI